MDYSSVGAIVLRSKICSGGGKGLESVDWFVSGCVCLGVIVEDVECAGLNRFVGDFGETIVVIGTSITF